MNIGQLRYLPIGTIKGSRNLAISLHRGIDIMTVILPRRS
jgi:hypothetical protein